VAGEQDNTVRIMSIHKSKGLEFPVVFLAGLGKRFNKQDAYGQILLDADLGAAADFLDLELRVKAPTLKKQALKRRMELETMGEELRVLYVAMTRAKEKLIMTAADKSLENKLGKWKDIPLSQGQLPYTILASANSCLAPYGPARYSCRPHGNAPDSGKRSDWRGNYPANHTEDEKGRPSEPGWGEGV